MCLAGSERGLTIDLRRAQADGRNDMVHSHIKNMSMAGMITKSRPSVSPKIRGVDDDRSSEERERDIKDIREKDLIKDRSPLADMLYLRCKCPHAFRVAS